MKRKTEQPRAFAASVGGAAPSVQDAPKKRVRHREPLVHISKRPALVWWKGWIIRGVALLLALMLSSVIIFALTKENPLEIYKAMVEENFGRIRYVFMTLTDFAFLLMVALALTPSFKMRFWNCGGNGQILAGCAAGAACMIAFGETMNPVLYLIVVTAASLAAGALWGIIPAFCKAHWNTNETLFTLMMNYIATAIVSCLIVLWENPKNSAKVGTINADSRGGWLSLDIQIVNERGVESVVNILPLVVAVVLCVVMYFYLKHLKQGYEISVVGESPNTARYVGINVKKVIIRTVAISGALCGLVGMLFVTSNGHTIAENTHKNYGFTAMLVSWLAKFNPLAMALTSFLVVFLNVGSGALMKRFGLTPNLAEIITAIILLFVIGCEFFIQYKLNVRLPFASKNASPADGASGTPEAAEDTAAQDATEAETQEVSAQ